MRLVSKQTVWSCSSKKKKKHKMHKIIIKIKQQPLKITFIFPTRNSAKLSGLTSFAVRKIGRQSYIFLVMRVAEEK